MGIVMPHQMKIKDKLATKVGLFLKMASSRHVTKFNNMAGLTLIELGQI